ncbi:aryl-sulfate sulfotransferase [bacterium]|nr:aryl-sulfate sulfotransferase [candidate division CSSED10-310 bacterium]
MIGISAARTWSFLVAAIVVCRLASGVYADDPFEGKTLISRLNSSSTIMIDMNGSTIKTWHGASQPGQVAYWFSDDSILRTSQTFNSTFGGGGSGGRLQLINASDMVVWDFTFSTTEHQQHHDIAVMPNGNILLVCWERKTRTEAQAMGRTSVMGDMWPTKIAEVQPSGTSGGTVIWEWHMWDHLIQDADSGKPNYGVIADHPELLDINVGSLSGGSGDWEHINAIDYNPVLDQIVISSHTLDEFYIIDHGTTTAEAASHAGGNCGKGGDLLYRWGNPQNYDRGTSANRHFYVCHGVNWIDEDLPGAGHILILNNGDRSGSSNDYSSAEEIVSPLLPDGNYSITSGQPYGPAAPVWTYSDPGTFYSSHLGGAYRLPNGNTIITEGTSGYMFEVSANGQVVWDHDVSGELARVVKYSLTTTPSATPTRTATPTPTFTSTVPHGEPTHTPFPTMSPTATMEDGMRLMLEDDHLDYGDRCYLHFTIGPRLNATEMDVYLLLDVFGEYWCWPEWRPLDEGIDYGTYSLDAWETVAEDVLDFTWPMVEGTGAGLLFYGAAFARDTFDLLGELQVIEFSYS